MTRHKVVIYIKYWRQQEVYHWGSSRSENGFFAAVDNQLEIRCKLSRSRLERSIAFSIIFLSLSKMYLLVLYFTCPSMPFHLSYFTWDPTQTICSLFFVYSRWNLFYILITKWKLNWLLIPSHHELMNFKVYWPLSANFFVKYLHRTFIFLSEGPRMQSQKFSFLVIASSLVRKIEFSKR